VNVIVQRRRGPASASCFFTSSRIRLGAPNRRDIDVYCVLNLGRRLLLYPLSNNNSSPPYIYLQSSSIRVDTPPFIAETLIIYETAWNTTNGNTKTRMKRELIPVYRLEIVEVPDAETVLKNSRLAKSCLGVVNHESKGPFWFSSVVIKLPYSKGRQNSSLTSS
jgi:hypothetical protein